MNGVFLPLFSDVISTANGEEIANVFPYCQFTQRICPQLKTLFYSTESSDDSGWGADVAVA